MQGKGSSFISFLSTVVEDPEYQSGLKKIEPTTFRSAVKCSTDRANPAAVEFSTFFFFVLSSNQFDMPCILAKVSARWNVPVFIHNIRQ